MKPKVPYVETNEIQSESDPVPARVDAALQNLSDLERDVITALFFDPSATPKSHDQIASMYGLSLQEVRNLSDQGLRKLRGNGRMKGAYPVSWN